MSEVIAEVSDHELTNSSDTFVGAYASNYLHQKSQNRWDIREAVERASSASAWTIGEIGAQAAIPWADQIDSIPAKVDTPVEASPTHEETKPVHEGTDPAQEETTPAVQNLALEQQ